MFISGSYVLTDHRAAHHLPPPKGSNCLSHSDVADALIPVCFLHSPPCEGNPVLWVFTATSLGTHAILVAVNHLATTFICSPSTVLILGHMLSLSAYSAIKPNKLIYRRIRSSSSLYPSMHVSIHPPCLSKCHCPLHGRKCDSTENVYPPELYVSEVCFEWRTGKCWKQTSVSGVLEVFWGFYSVFWG